MLPMTVIWSFSDGNAMRYVLPVLWMTSCFHTMGPNGQWARIKHDAMFRSLPGGTNWTSRILQCLVEFIRMRHRGRSLLFTIDLFVL